jgi:molybdopterin-synthase adenylyltransferase
VKTIVVVGVGALGSHVVQLLRNVDATIRVIDFDRVEQKNVASQFHAKQSVGKSKVVGLQQTMQFLFGTKIETVPHKLVAENATQLLGSGDLVIDCLDNAASRRILQVFVRAHSAACLHGALAAEATFGRVVWDEDFTIDEEPGEGAPTCDDGDHLPFIATTAALIAQAAAGFIRTGKKVGFQIHPGGVTRT